MNKKTKRKPKVIVSIYRGCAEVVRLPYGIIVEIRDFDVADDIDEQRKRYEYDRPYERRVYES